MNKVAYSLQGAAKAAGVKEDTIIQAIRSRQLVARRLVDAEPVVLATDIQAWLEAQPDYYL